MSQKASPLRRVVSTSLLALYGIGNIVGAGVYVLVGKIAEPAGYLAVLAFMLAALVAFCAALSYAELAARFPVSAGVAVYLHEAFKVRRLSTIVGLMLVAAGIVSSATLLKGFAGYFHELVAWDMSLIILGVALVLLAVTLKGIRESVGMAALFTIVEVCGLLFLVGSIMISQPDWLRTFGDGFGSALGSFDGAAAAGIISAAFIAFYAFVGFEDMVNIAEEVKEPQKAFPRAIIASMAIVTVLYVIVAVAALAVLSPGALGSSTAPLADAYHAATGNAAGIITIISLIAILNGILANVIMGSRFLYGMGRKGWLPTWFSGVWARTHVPARGLIVVMLIALGCALWLPLTSLAQITSLLLLFVFFAVNVSLVVVRKKQDQVAGKSLRISPNYMPWVGAVASILLLAGQVITMIR